ncbi:TolC family protein [Clostridium sp.]|uniref:TolC family protein n=1 Tax=Clostridium sp. TaxID=1506 RepID=UPI003D6CD663
MNKKAKLVVSSLAILGVLSTIGMPVFGANKNSTEVMDMESVIAAVASGNSSLSLYDKKIKILTEKINAVVPYDEETNYDRGTRADETDYQREMRLNVNPPRRELELHNLLWDKQQDQDEIVISSKQYYYQYVLQDQIIELQKSKIERLKKVLENKKAGIDIGTEAGYTLIDDQVNVNDAETALLQLINEKENIRMKLNINMGKNVDAPLMVKTKDIPYEEYKADKLDDVVAKTSKGYHTITAMSEEIRLDTKEKGIADEYDTDPNQLVRAASPNTDYKSWSETLGDTIVNLGYDLTDESIDVESKIRTDYNNVLNLNNTVLVKKLDCDKAETLLNTEKARLTAGQSVQLSVDTAQEMLNAATVELSKAKIDYFEDAQQFKNYIK